MVILSFKEEWKEKIINLEKQQTIRYNFYYWDGNYQKHHFLDIWCPGPRSGKGKKLCELWVWCCKPILGIDFTNEIAKKDGFESKIELIKWLMKAHKLTFDGVMNHEWALIQFQSNKTDFS